VKPNTTVEADGQRIVVRIELDRDQLNETIAAVLRQEMVRFARNIMERGGPKWVQDHLGEVVARVAAEHEAAVVEAARAYFRDHGRAKVERMLDESVERAVGALKRRILGREDVDPGRPGDRGEGPR